MQFSSKYDFFPWKHVDTDFKHLFWQLFTITDKGIPETGNSQIAKASRGLAPGPHMGAYIAPITPSCKVAYFTMLKMLQSALN